MPRSSVPFPPTWQVFGRNPDLQTPFDAAVIMPTVGRDSIKDAVESVYRQENVRRIQLLIGVDAPSSDLGPLLKQLEAAPEPVTPCLFYPGYSTSVRHGGLHPARDGGTLRTSLSYLANARHLAYLDDDNWWAPDHLCTLLAAIKGHEWAFALRWFVHPETRKPVCVDDWESVGPGRGMFLENFGGWVDPNCLMIDKLACDPALRLWSFPLPGDAKAMSADRNVFDWLQRKSAPGETNRTSAYYTMTVEDGIHVYRLDHMGPRYAAAGPTPDADQPGPSAPAAVKAPRDAAAADWEGRAALARGDFETAEALVRPFLASGVGPLPLWRILASALRQQGRIEETLPIQQMLVDTLPGDLPARFDLSETLLLLGDFERGWREYRYRYSLPHTTILDRKVQMPTWSGEPIPGKTLLIHDEQGYGDTLQFMRMAPWAKQRSGARVVLEINHETASFARRMAGIDHVALRGELPPPFDVHCQMMSLPATMGLKLSDLPGTIPYLSIDPARVNRWRKRLSGLPRPLVALVWAGRPTHFNDANRSTNLAMLAPLAQDGVTFLAVQKGPKAVEAADPPKGMHLVELSDKIKDFDDTAAILTLADLLISVDSSPVHLAGALGRPAWVMLPFVPDWRWLLGRDDTPWTHRSGSSASPGAATGPGWWNAWPRTWRRSGIGSERADDAHDAAPIPRGDMMNILFVTGCDRGFFNTLLICLHSFSLRLPGQRLYVCDFGLSAQQAAFLRQIGILIERPPTIDRSLDVFTCKAALGRYLKHAGHGADRYDAVVWVDADLTFMDVGLAHFQAVVSEMKRLGAPVAVCPEPSGNTVGGIISALARPPAPDPFAAVAEDTGIDLARPYVSTGLFFINSTALLDRWAHLTLAVEPHTLFEQNMFNIVLPCLSG